MDGGWTLKWRAISAFDLTAPDAIFLLMACSIARPKSLPLSIA